MYSVRRIPTLIRKQRLHLEYKHFKYMYRFTRKPSDDHYDDTYKPFTEN